MQNLTLHEYQELGVSKMLSRELTPDCYGLYGGIVADEMGLGKTIQSLALMIRNPKRTLVVCPVSIMHQWREECIKFTGIQPLIVNVANVRKIGKDGGTNPLYVSIQEIEEAQLVIASHSCFNNPTALQTLDDHSLLNACFDRVIFDEAHILKNPRSQCAYYAPQIAAPIRWCLTGTPVITKKKVKTNRGVASEDVTSLITFLLGDPEARSKAKKMAKNQAYRRDLILRRTKESVGETVESLRLPPAPIHLHMVDFDDENRQRYAELYRTGRLLTNKILEGEDVGGHTHVFSVITKLRQHCSNAPSKLQALNDCFDQHPPGSRSLVFCNYLEEMNSVVRLLRDRDEDMVVMVYHGGMTSAQKNDVVQTFMNTESGYLSRHMCMVIQFTAGSVGLNLQAAEHVYIMSPHWSAATELQAISRAHRTKTQHMVNITRFVMKHTVEEYVHLRQKSKLKVAAECLDDPKIVEALEAHDGTSVTWQEAQELFGSDLFD